MAGPCGLANLKIVFLSWIGYVGIAFSLPRGQQIPFPVHMEGNGISGSRTIYGQFPEGGSLNGTDGQVFQPTNPDGQVRRMLGKAGLGRPKSRFAG